MRVVSISSRLVVLWSAVVWIGCGSESDSSFVQDQVVDGGTDGGVGVDTRDTMDDVPLPDLEQQDGEDGSVADVDGAAASDTDAIEDSDSPHDAEQEDTADLADDTGDGSSLIGEKCFSEIYDPQQPSGPDYDQFQPVVGSHCMGTNHQDITGVKRVVFLGDSVTVGTPSLLHLLSIDNEHFYRNLLAEWLADHFDLDRGNLVEWGLWKAYNYITGKGGTMEAGDFKHCARWGARTDDLLTGREQIPECFPSGGSNKRTLFVFTMGGNDIAAINRAGGEASGEEVAAGYPSTWAMAQSAVQHLEEAVQHILDPENFPNGAYIIYSNGFEFTDSTGQIDSCTPQTTLDIPGVGEVDLSEYDLPVASLVGYKAWEEPEIQEEIVVWILEQYMRIAVQYQIDVTWTLEKFCGHGYVTTGPNADSDNRCYRGPDSELYFDETCIHPSDAGHNAMFQMFQALVLE